MFVSVIGGTAALECLLFGLNRLHPLRHGGQLDVDAPDPLVLDVESVDHLVGVGLLHPGHGLKLPDL